MGGVTTVDSGKWGFWLSVMVSGPTEATGPKFVTLTLLW